MRLKKAAVVLAAGAATLLGSSAKAHIPFIEPEAREDDPASLSESERAELDYSFDNPFPLEEDRAFAALPENTFAFDGIDSMAINGYLTPGDIDVYRVVAAENDGNPIPFDAILASALPPACAELLDSYPLVALVGPGLPREQAVLDLLPFNIDEPPVPQPSDGMNGALFAPNPVVERREIFVEDVVTGLSWFLPEGLTQECLEPPSNPFAACETFNNTIVTAPGQVTLGEPYYVAVWDPANEAQDYTMTLGITDAHYVDRPDINADIECFKTVHGECTAPYEDVPEGYFAAQCAELEADGDTGDSSGCAVGPLQGDSAVLLVAIFLIGVLVRRRLA